MPELVLIAGVAKTGVIGDGEDIPWNNQEDHEQYLSRVTGSPVIVGRKTFDQMGQLPETPTVIVTRSPQTDRSDRKYVSSVPEAVEAVREFGKQAYVLGGQSIYALFLPYADRALVSEIPETAHGSRVFPYMGTDWEETAIHEYETFTLVEYVQPDPDSIESH